MKQLKIKISFATNNEINHTIHLGNCEWLTHKKKSFLKLYLSTYKKVLFDNVNNLNNYNALIYNLYRSFYFDFNAMETERLNDCFDVFNKQYNWIFHSTYDLENSQIFNKIKQSIYALYDVLSVMKVNAQKNKNYSLKRQVESFLKMVADLERKYEDDRRSLNLTRDYTETKLRIIKKELKRMA